MDKDKLKDILARYRSGTATDEDKAFLESWYLHQETNVDDYQAVDQVEDVNAVWKNLESDFESSRHRLSWNHIAAAAVVIIALTMGLYFYAGNKTNTDAAAVKFKQDALAPGTNVGILTLANGRKINLSDAKDGELARQSGIVVTKSSNGQITYSVSGTSTTNQPLVYNTIETPRGGQYQIRLPDGSSVWLNSASSLKYPATFSSLHERTVELVGEAYFEVAKDKFKPFRVVSANQTVWVLGTHFSVSAYNDDAKTVTTLVEGSVQVSAGKHKNVIQPGQQTVLKQGVIRIQAADVEEALAWKNGYFRFNDEHINDVVRKLSRWYNVDFDFEGTPTEERFNGVISRSKNLPQVLKMLEKTKAIHFKVAGRRITVK